MLVHVLGHRLAVESLDLGRVRAARARDREGATAGGIAPPRPAAHLRLELPQLAQIVGARAVARVEALVPLRAVEEPLLRLAAENLLGPHRFARRVAARERAHLLEHRHEGPIVVARNRHVVRAPGVGGDGSGARSRRAARHVLELQDHEVADARALEGPRRGQAGDPGAEDRDAHLLGRGRASARGSRARDGRERGSPRRSRLRSSAPRARGTQAARAEAPIAWSAVRRETALLFNSSAATPPRSSGRGPGC